MTLDFLEFWSVAKERPYGAVVRLEIGKAKQAMLGAVYIAEGYERREVIGVSVRSPCG